MPEMEMARIGDYCDVIRGKIGIKKAVAGKYPLVTTAEDRLSHNESHFEKPSVIIPVVSSTGHGHASLRRIHYQEGKFAIGSILCAVTPKDEKVLNANYLYHYLDVYKEKLLVLRMKGMANVTLPVKEIENVEFPLLSIEKQMEWVALFEKTTSYTGSLTSEITHQQTLLKKLRQSIRQDAISGKLTEKWRKENPDVEPATELLERIKAEKERMVKEKKIKKQKPLLPVRDDEIPFELPEGWVWCRLGDFLITYVDCPHATPKYQNNGYICLRSNNITEKGLDLTNVKYINQEEYKFRISRLVPHINDVLYIREGGRLGVSCILKSSDKLCLGQRMMLFRLQDNICSEHFNMLLHSPLILGYVKKLILGAASPRINIKDIINFLIPVPPELEIKEIVNKLDMFNTMLHELEQQTSKSQQDSELLMQAVLQEAFQVEAGVM